MWLAISPHRRPKWCPLPTAHLRRVADGLPPPLAFGCHERSAPRGPCHAPRGWLPRASTASLHTLAAALSKEASRRRPHQQLRLDGEKQGEAPLKQDPEEGAGSNRVKKDDGATENGMPATGPLCDVNMARRVGVRCGTMCSARNWRSTTTGCFVLPTRSLSARLVQLGFSKVLGATLRLAERHD